MKRSSIIGFLLAFLSFLLILSATVVFLWQGRQEMLERIGTLETQVSQLENDALILQANRAAEAAALATSQAVLATRDAEVARSQQEVVDLQQERAILTAQLNITPTPDAMAGQPPQIELVAPLSGTVYSVGEPVAIVAFVGHTAGISGVDLLVNGEKINSYRSDLPFLTIEDSPRFESPGTYEIAVVATSREGVASQPVTVTIEVRLPVPTAVPQTATPVTGTTSLREVGPFVWPVVLLVAPGRGS